MRLLMVGADLPPVRDEADSQTRTVTATATFGAAA